MSGTFGSANRDYWDDKARFNVATWDVDAFVADPGRLTTIVTADREALGTCGADPCSICSAISESGPSGYGCPAADDRGIARVSV